MDGRDKPGHDKSGVRDYAARLNERQVEIAQETTVVGPESGAALPRSPGSAGATGSDASALPASSGTGLTPAQAQAGMDEMSTKFREMGGQVYVDAERVKRSNEALG